MRYTLTHEPAAEGDWATWRVDLQVTGLGSRRATFQMSDWGGWADNDFEYLEVLDCRPPLREADPRGGRFVANRSRDGSSHFSYRLRVPRLRSAAQQRYGLLPTWCEEYAFGYSWNSLVQVLVDDEPVESVRSLELVAPEGTTIVTGWAGVATGRQQVSLDAAMGNGPIAFGTPAGTHQAEGDGMTVTVFQFGKGPDVTTTVAEVLLRCGPAFGDAFGVPPRVPYRAFVTDTQGGGMGSHFGLRIGVMEDAPTDHAQSPWLRHHIAHELCHDWLGTLLTEEDRSLVWFKEGFAEYLSLWQVTAAELVSREYFRRRILELESIARNSPAYGQVSFADPEVVWRDGDGPNETLAYCAAPALALALDVELREKRRPGLPQLVRDLLARDDPRYGQDDLRRWLEKNRLKERHRRSLEGTEIPDVATSLQGAGYRRVEETTDLTYFGLATDHGNPGATVLAVDPRGPAAQAGIQKGDVLTGWFPVRSTAARAESFDTPFPFGLGTFEPGHEGTFLGIHRDGEDHKLFVDPRVIRGKGVLGRWEEDPEALDAFFTFRGR